MITSVKHSGSLAALERAVALIVFLLMGLAVFPLSGHAQVWRVEKKFEACLDFRWNSVFLDLHFRENQQEWLLLRGLLDSLTAEVVDSVVVISHSSPEGRLEANRLLSIQRAQAVSELLLREYPLLKGRLRLRAQGESWQTLGTFIEKDEFLEKSQKDRLARLLNSASSLLARKESLTSSKEYGYLYRTYYPELRYTQVVIYYGESSPFRPIPISFYLPEWKRSDPVFADWAERVDCTQKRTVLAVKTNLLYDALTALNIELEVPIGLRWSVAVEDVFPWWNNGNKWAFQLWEMGIEGRYWFKRTEGRDVLSGHFGGLYGMGAKYDFQYRRKGCYQGECWSVGLTYGYALPIGSSFNLEFALSVGYLSTDYRHYHPAKDWNRLVNEPCNADISRYVGPTKVKISLIYPIQFRVKKKGGRHD